MPNVAPRLSIIVAASHSTEAASAFLDSARPSAAIAEPGCEWIIAYDPQAVAPPAMTMAETVGDRILWVAGEPGALAARLRYWGFVRSRGETIVFTEDSCRAEPGWLDSWLKAAGGFEAATGLVRPDDGLSSRDLAIVLCEYAEFLRPEERLAGNHFALSRDRAGSLADVAGEVREIAALRIGERPTIVLSAQVRHTRSYALGESLRDRFRFGLDYGGYRSRGRSWTYRLLGFAALPAIAAAQLRKIAAASRKAGSRDWRRPRVFGWLLVLIACWSVGEWLGWAFAARSGLQPQRLRSRYSR